MTLKSLRLAAALAAMALLATCGSPAPDDRPIAVAPSAGTAADPALCGALERIADAESDGFAPLRAAPLEQARWTGAVVPAGAQRCEVVGAGRHDARYVCLLGASDEGIAALAPEFEQTIAGVDACLARGAAAGRFMRSRAFSFQDGERILVWQDVSASPAPGFLLRLDQVRPEQAGLLTLSGLTLR
jgi:hypothetical protein